MDQEPSVDEKSEIRKLDRSLCWGGGSGVNNVRQNSMWIDLKLVLTTY